jgi:hypothetical protein
MRYTMPIVVMLRDALRRSGSTPEDDELIHAGFETVSGIMRLMSPDLQGCGNLPNVRTWCTDTGDWYQGVSSHRAALAYFASEGLRLLAECRQRRELCPLSIDRIDLTLVRWFDILLWDHALLDGTALRNSLTQSIQHQQPATSRLLYLHGSFDPSVNDKPPFRFATDGWWIALAANLLAVDRLLSGEDDPRSVALTAQQDAALRSLVDVGMEVLGQRADPTRLRDFDGDEVSGLQFDSKLWDRHEYRRFSAVSEGARPFSVVLDPAANTPGIVYADGHERRAENVGLDSGHYRRLTWLHYALSDVQDSVDAGWVDDEILEGLANQFAYGVHWHPCHHLRTSDCSSTSSTRNSEDVPRFVNYASGHRGWYRLTPTQPCDAGVPPFGFSTLMVISESLWWARFNSDIARIWTRLDAAVNDPDLPAPSSGDTVPCGENVGRTQWNETYHQMAFRSDGRLTKHGLGFYAMRYWAQIALGSR